MLKRLLISSACLAVSTGTAIACAFHNYAPDPTMVDRLLGSDHVVLARPSADDPLKMVPVEALIGGLAYVALPDLSDPGHAADLAEDPDALMLYARDGAYGPWQELAVIDEDMGLVLDFVWSRVEDWQFGGDEERFGFFANLANHPDPDVQELALRELDQADYSILRQLRIDANPQDKAARLFLPQEGDLAPIRVLVLGLSGGQEIAPLLREGVTANLDGTGPMLGAFATAYIEHQGAPAVAELTTRYLSDTALPPDSRELLTEALAMHAQSGAADTQRAVRAAVTDVLRADPTLAPFVARQFGMRSEWSQREALRDILHANALRSPLDIILVSQYVALADEAIRDG